MRWQLFLTLPKTFHDMIESIIKRDGTREPFEATKLNKWAIWSAADVRERADWPSVVTKTVKALSGKEVSSQDLQRELIKQLVYVKRWPEALMAGRLYAALTRKEIYDDRIPTVRKLHDKLTKLGLMEQLPYSVAEYALIEKIIDHERDFHLSFAQVKQIRKKYAIQNAIKKTEYETPQFVFMRMAMKLSQNYTGADRLARIASFYNGFSRGRDNAPSPNFLNLGTPHRGFASCCLYAVGDTADSIQIGNHIAEKMAVMSAGIGVTIQVRGLGDPVRGGKFEHNGKAGYHKATGGVVTSGIAAGRNGACTAYTQVFDNEMEAIMMTQNPRTPQGKQNRDIHFAWQDNYFFARKVALNEPVFMFNCYTAPDLFQALFKGDPIAFEQLYKKYEADPKFVKKYVDARKLLITGYEQRQEVGTLYRMNLDEVNRHTSFREPIRSSNLCAEITQPTFPYYAMQDLYSSASTGYIVFEDFAGTEQRWDYSDRVEIQRGMDKFVTFAGDLKEGDVVFTKQERGAEKPRELPGNGLLVANLLEVRQESEVSTCSLGGVVVSKIENDEDAYQAAYNNLRMIYECIHLTKYAFPHLEYTAKSRMNAGVGILGLAHHLARKGLKYDTPEGLAEINFVMERHMYMLIKASIQLGREVGNAPWIHKTRWVRGWLPIDTYKKEVDELVSPETHYDWEAIRAELREQGGMAFSALAALMPTESSSKAAGAPNGGYPVRDLSMKKTDGSASLDWVAPDNDIYDEAYQLAWEISPVDQMKFYAVMQKWTDQAISADTYRDRTATIVNDRGETVVAPLSDESMLEEYLAAMKYGVKTQYYNNSFTGGKKMEEIKIVGAEEVRTPILTSVEQPTAEVSEVPPSAVDSLDALSEGGEGRGCEAGVCSL